MRRFESTLLLILATLAIASVGCGTRRDRTRPRDDGGGLPTPPDSGVPPVRDGGIPLPPDGGPRPCPPGQTDCGDGCVNTADDEAHCGDCGVACPPGYHCSDASCWPDEPACPPPRALCGEACVDLLTNPAHCGECFLPCEPGAFCSSGACMRTCVPSCGGRTCGPDGCGGVCGTCASGSSCVDGTCRVDCGPGLTLCSGSCVDTRTNASHCGGCGIACATGSTCVASVCTPAMPPPSGETCATALVFPAAGGVQTFTLTGRVANHTPFTCGTTSATPDVAYRWTPSRSGTASFAAAGPTSMVDVMLSVFSTSACTSTSSLGCNDDEATGVYSSRLSLTVTAGATYYVVVASYSTTPPTETITLSITAP